MENNQMINSNKGKKVANTPNNHITERMDASGIDGEGNLQVYMRRESTVMVLESFRMVRTKAILEELKYIPL